LAYKFSNLPSLGFCITVRKIQILQNEELSGFDLSHFEQTDARLFPQLLQNFEFIDFVYDKTKASTG